jgi:Flp pilus assembly protein TadD
VLRVTIDDVKRRGVALGAAVACLLGAAYLGSTLRDENRLQDANDAARAGDLRGALATARKITNAPSRTRARGLEAFALLQLGDLAAADRAFARAVSLAPNDAELRLGWAEALLRAGRRDKAERQLARAVALNPGIALPPGFRR